MRCGPSGARAGADWTATETSSLGRPKPAPRSSPGMWQRQVQEITGAPSGAVELLDCSGARWRSMEVRSWPPVVVMPQASADGVPPACWPPPVHGSTTNPIEVEVISAARTRLSIFTVSASSAHSTPEAACQDTTGKPTRQVAYSDEFGRSENSSRPTPLRRSSSPALHLSPGRRCPQH